MPSYVQSTIFEDIDNPEDENKIPKKRGIEIQVLFSSSDCYYKMPKKSYNLRNFQKIFQYFLGYFPPKEKKNYKMSNFSYFPWDMFCSWALRNYL